VKANLTNASLKRINEYLPLVKLLDNLLSFKDGSIELF
jgi:hypothetical protein